MVCGEAGGAGTPTTVARVPTASAILQRRIHIAASAGAEAEGSLILCLTLNPSENKTMYFSDLAALSVDVSP